MKRGICLKKIFIYLFVFIITIIIIITINISNNNSLRKDIRDFNLQYEMYKDRILQGTDVATIINKAINNKDGYSIKTKGRR